MFVEHYTVEQKGRNVTRKISNIHTYTRIEHDQSDLLGLASRKRLHTYTLVRVTIRGRRTSRIKLNSSFLSSEKERY
jgi:hypothetical protein